MTIKPKKLDAGDFAKFGRILTAYSGEPDADDDVVTYWGGVADADFTGPVSAGMLLGHPRRMATSKLERHLSTPEVLVALDGDALLCVGAPGEPKELTAFFVKQGEGVALHAGTWHWTPFPTGDRDCRFLVLFHSGTEKNDLEIRELPEEIFFES